MTKTMTINELLTNARWIAKRYEAGEITEDLFMELLSDIDVSPGTAFASLAEHRELWATAR
jgi:hypothetical protein